MTLKAAFFGTLVLLVSSSAIADRPKISAKNLASILRLGKKQTEACFTGKQYDINGVLLKESVNECSLSIQHRAGNLPPLVTARMGKFVTHIQLSDASEAPSFKKGRHLVRQNSAWAGKYVPNASVKLQREFKGTEVLNISEHYNRIRADQTSDDGFYQKLVVVRMSPLSTDPNTGVVTREVLHNVRLSDEELSVLKKEREEAIELAKPLRKKLRKGTMNEYQIAAMSYSEKMENEVREQNLLTNEERAILAKADAPITRETWVTDRHEQMSPNLEGVSTIPTSFMISYDGTAILEDRPFLQCDQLEVDYSGSACKRDIDDVLDGEIDFLPRLEANKLTASESRDRPMTAAEAETSRQRNAPWERDLKSIESGAITIQEKMKP